MQAGGDLRQRWENGEHYPETWTYAYATAFEADKDAFFGRHVGPEPVVVSDRWMNGAYSPEEDPTKRRQFIIEFLAGLGVAGAWSDLIAIGVSPRIGQEHVEFAQTVLHKLERLDAQRGGDHICDGAATLLAHVHSWIQNGSYPADVGRSLSDAAGHLGAWVGWTAYDANRLTMARQYYWETMLMARTRDDLQLEARVLSYMSMLARVQRQPRESVHLAETALRVSAGWTTPRMSALLNLRCAQGYAWMGDRDGFRRHLIRAKHDFEGGPREDDLSFLGALTPSEVAGIEGVAHIALGEPDRAASLFQGISEEPDSTYRRNSVYYTVRLADAFHRAGDQTSAFAAADAVPMVAEVDSARTRAKLASLRQLAANAKIPAAGQFSDRYDEAFT